MKLSPRFIKLQMGIQFKLQALSAITFILMVIQPVVFGGIGLILGRSYSQDPMQLIISILGGGLLGIWGNVMYISAFDITRDRWDGVLEQIVGSPVEISQILRIRCLTNVLVGAITLAISVLIASLFYDFHMSLNQAAWLLISIMVTLVGFWSMGVFLANITALSRKSKLLITFIDLPIIVLSGFMFPIELLPQWMQWVAAIIPIRWSGSAIKASIAVGSFDIQQMLIWIALTLLISAIYYLLSKRLAGLVHDKIRVNGEAKYI